LRWEPNVVKKENALKSIFIERRALGGRRNGDEKN
jgi:hypothetical protein